MKYTTLQKINWVIKEIARTTDYKLEGREYATMDELPKGKNYTYEIETKYGTLCIEMKSDDEIEYVEYYFHPQAELFYSERDIVDEMEQA